MVVRGLISTALLFPVFCYTLILEHSLQCDTFTFVWAALNETRWKVPTCQTDCKVVFSWTRTSTHLMLFPVETVLLQCHGRSGWCCPRRTLTTEAPGAEPTDECPPTVEGAHKDKNLISPQSPLSGQIHTRNMRSVSPSADCGGNSLICSCRLSRRLACCVLMCLGSWSLRVGYLSTPYNFCIPIWYLQWGFLLVDMTFENSI